MDTNEFAKRETRDFYDCIGSEEIRNYYRDNISLPSLEEGYLISRSFLPVYDKIKMLESIGSYDSEYYRMIMDFARIYQYSLEQILNPSKRCIYIVERRESLRNLKKENDEFYIFRNVSCYGYDIFDTYQEVLEDAVVNRQDKEKQEILNVVQICIEENGTSTNYISFDIAFFEGKPEIYYITIEDDAILKEWGFSQEVIDEFQNHTDYCHFPLPYKTGDRLKVKTPYMDEAVYGTLSSEMDANRCWYHFLYLDGEVFDGPRGFIDLSYHEFGHCGRLSVFDWVERAEPGKQD